MWIDSQNAKTFINIKYTKVLTVEDLIASNNYGIFADDNFLGNYNTEERALQILNEIKNMISDPDNYTYEMPLE